MKWLDSEALGRMTIKKTWFTWNILKYRDNKILDFLCKDATKEFKKI